MAFGISPATPTIAAGDNPPATSDGFPRYIQFQNNGTDLGAPDVDTVNFADNLTVTRGTGENANKVTVVAAAVAPGGGSETGTLVVRLVGAADGAFNNAAFSNWTGTVLNTSDDATWNEASNQVEFATAGVYSVRVVGRIVAATDWAPNDESAYGASVTGGSPGVRSVHTRYAGFQGSMTWDTAQFTDEFVVEAVAPDPVEGSDFFIPALYAAVTAYDNSSAVATFSAVVLVKRLV